MLEVHKEINRLWICQKCTKSRRLKF